MILPPFYAVPGPQFSDLVSNFVETRTHRGVIQLPRVHTGRKPDVRTNFAVYRLAIVRQRRAAIVRLCGRPSDGGTD